MNEVNAFAVNSNQIILECLKEHGKGELFFRTDGLEFETRRAAARAKFLKSNPEIEPKHCDAILRAAITPGMTRQQVTAAWGLLEDDTRLVFGHVVEERRTAYAYFTGFNVPASHALYFHEDLLLGVRQTDEWIPFHEKELDMRFAEEFGLFYFYDGNDGQLRGSNVDQYKMDWDTQHLRLYVIEIVPPSSIRKIESYMTRYGLTEKYETALLQLGYDSRTAPAKVRTHVALSVIPYPRLRGAAADEEEEALSETSDGPRTKERQALPKVIALPAAPVPDPATLPPEEWLAEVRTGLRQEVRFPSSKGGSEIVRVDWMRERLFRVEEVPLFVNGVSLYDLVEVEWRGKDLIPYFKRVAENYGYRTIRAVVNDLDRSEDIEDFAKKNTDDSIKYRCEQGVLVMTVRKPGVDDFVREWLGYLPLTWVYTDTLTMK